MLLASFPEQWVMAWESEGREEDIKEESGDSSATYLPDGELLLALDNYTDLGFYIDGNRYRLAYKFDIKILTPVHTHKTYFVDASTGETFKELSEQHTDAAASISVNNDAVIERVIDTRYRGFPNYDHVLETDDGDTRVHTKKGILDGPYDPAWIIRAEIDKNDEPWTGYKMNATTAHYYAQQAWYYFRDVFGRDGMDDDNEKLRVHFDVEGAGQLNAFYERDATVDNLVFWLHSGVTLGNFADVVGHEYFHGIIEHSSELIYNGESGALNESFADIFGVMVERAVLTVGGTGAPNWIVGEGSGRERWMNGPKFAGEHSDLDADDFCFLDDGQPDTYLGTHWQETTITCDAAGVHGNRGVQNFWFYLLSNGQPIGLNDNGYEYSIEGIGVDNAASIAYWNVVNVLTSGSQYSDAREGAIASAILLFGECTNEHFQTLNPWAAVGVGDPSDCEEVLSLEEKTDFQEFTIYPNPTEDSFRIESSELENFDLNIYNIDGKRIFTLSSVGNNTEITLPNVASGVYIVEIKDGSKIIRKRLIKK